MPYPTRKSLDLDDTNRTKVFRQLVAIFRDDKVLDRVVGSKHWRTYSGDAVDRTPFPPTATPAVVISRVPGPEEWWSPDSMTGDMLVQLLLQIRGTCEDDADNLYGAFQRAVYPADPSKKLANLQFLQAAGAHTGIVTFAQPAFDHRTLDGQASEGLILARGGMKITIRNRF